MSIHKHEYRAYTGRLTPVRTRVFVLARYGFAEVWSSKITIVLFLLCLIPSLGFLVQIYAANNPLAQSLLGDRAERFLAADVGFFLHMLETQSWVALALSAWVAPRLISYDLADNALPILLSHPITRFGYVLGKYIALFCALSAVTWIPGLLLFCYEGYASSQPWFVDNLRIAIGLFVGAVLWIGFLSIFGLALSSWVKWRVVATGAIFAAVLVPAGVGAIVSHVLRTNLGFLLNIPVMMSILWRRLLGASETQGPDVSLPTVAILIMLALACCLSIAMLNRRIRAREIVRG